MSAPEDPDKPRLPDFIAKNWDVGATEVVLEEDGMRVIVELEPRVEGVEPTTFEFFSKPF